MKLGLYYKIVLLLVLTLTVYNGVEAKKKAKKGKNPAKKSQKVSELPKLRLVHWFGNMSDLTYRCPSTTYPNYKRIVPVAADPIFTVSDCSVEGSRWDYDIKVCSMFH